LVGDQMVGVAAARLKESDNIGYITPAEEIDLFLKDAADGRYDGKPVLLDDVEPLVNRALRDKYGVPKEARGLLVTRPFRPSEGDPLRAGDVVTRIGDVAIDNAGMVRVEGDLMLNYRYLVQRSARDGKLPMHVLREGRELGVEVPVGPERD